MRVNLGHQTTWSRLEFDHLLNDKDRTVVRIAAPIANASA
jgi:hypothetical protein